MTPDIVMGALLAPIEALAYWGLLALIVGAAVGLYMALKLERRAE